MKMSVRPGPTRGPGWCTLRGARGQTMWPSGLRGGTGSRRARLRGSGGCPTATPGVPRERMR